MRLSGIVFRMEQALIIVDRLIRGSVFVQADPWSSDDEYEKVAVMVKAEAFHQAFTQDEIEAAEETVGAINLFPPTDAPIPRWPWKMASVQSGFQAGKIAQVLSSSGFKIYSEPGGEGTITLYVKADEAFRIETLLADVSRQLRWTPGEFEPINFTVGCDCPIN